MKIRAWHYLIAPITGLVFGWAIGTLVAFTLLLASPESELAPIFDPSIWGPMWALCGAFAGLLNSACVYWFVGRHQ